MISGSGATGLTRAPMAAPALSATPSSLSLSMASQSSSNPLSKKITKILETKLDQNRELLEPLKGLSEFYGVNTVEARRNLRSRVEKRNVEMNQEFVDMLAGLNRKVKLVFSLSAQEKKVKKNISD